MPTDVTALKQDLTRRMEGAMETLKKEFSGLRTGRASPALLEPVRVEAYGSVTPLNQVANISVAGPGLLAVQVWDKGMTKAVESAIREANLGLNPQAEGQVIRVPLPPLTTDRRNELAKAAARYAERPQRILPRHQEGQERHDGNADDVRGPRHDCWGQDLHRA